jgi:putative membrane-bound dehydrogenase-like protein
MKRLFLFLGAALAVALSATGCGPAPLIPPASTPVSPTPVDVSPSVTAPGVRPTPPLPTVPSGFRLTLVSDQPKIASALARDGDFFYVTELRTGNVLRLADSDGDGRLDSSLVVASGFNMPRALAFHPESGELYVSSRGQVNGLSDTNADGVADVNRVVVDGLYDLDFMHTNNGIAFGPDGKLYIADGAPRLRRIKKKGEAAMEPFAGTILTVNPDGSELEVFARGFRNPFGLAFAPDGSLYATDNGEDSIPEPFHGDELNLIVQGGHYGYPEVLADPPPGSDTIAPLVNFPADSAPTAVLFYDAEQFPEAFRDSLFVGLWSIGHKVVRVWRDANGTWLNEDFITNMQFPMGLALGADGSLYVLDMADGVDGGPGASSRIYRVEYVE